MSPKYYEFRLIEEFFRHYNEGLSSQMTEDEFLVFCHALKVLPRTEIDRFRKEIYLIALSSGDGEPNKARRGCYTSLEGRALNDKRGIIVLSPYTLGAPYVDKDQRTRNFYTTDYPTIIHEYAHHYMGHKDFYDEIEREGCEKKVEAQVTQWNKEFLAFLESQTEEERLQYDP